MAGLASGVRTAAGHAWPLLQATAMAVAAWAIARYLIHDHAPFFAPIAAAITLNAARGQRGLSGLRLMLGVFVGIVVGEVSVAVLGSGYPSLAAATFTALAIARALARTTLVLNQAAVAAILTVISAGGEAGPQRLIDALVGTGVALVGTQLLFSPEPVGMLLRAEHAALAGLSGLLEQLARSLEQRRPELPDEWLLEMPSAVLTLAQMRRTSGRAVRHSAVWRQRLGAVEEQQERTAAVELLAASTLTLCRLALAVRMPERAQLADPMRRFSHALAELAAGPADRTVRQRVADAALSAVHDLAGVTGTGESDAMTTAARVFTIDLLAVLGVDRDDAAKAVHSTERGVVVTAAPPTAPRLPLARSRPRPQ